MVLQLPFQQTPVARSRAKFVGFMNVPLAEPTNRLTTRILTIMSDVYSKTHKACETLPLDVRHAGDT